MRAALLCLLALVSPALPGCSQAFLNPDSVAGFRDPDSGGLKRASFELECPESQLQVIDLGSDSASIGVTGCGKKAVYKFAGNRGWVNNTLTPTPE